MRNPQANDNLDNLSDEELGNVLREALRAADQAEINAKEAKAQADPWANRSLSTARNIFHRLETNTVVDAFDNPADSSMEMIDYYLSTAGASITDLDETGQTSYDDMLMRISKAKQRTHFLVAKTALDILENPTPEKLGQHCAEECYEKVYLYSALSQGLEAQIDHVSEVGNSFDEITDVDLTPLDETGTTSQDDMRLRLSNALQSGSIYTARRRLESLQTGQGISSDFGFYAGSDYIDSHIRSIHRLFEMAGTDASCLDETGQKSEAEMLEVLADAEKGYRIRAARQRYKCLKSETLTDLLCTSSWRDEIRELFNQAGVDAACLDETGQKSAAEMEEEFQATLKAIQTRRTELFSPKS